MSHPESFASELNSSGRIDDFEIAEAMARAGDLTRSRAAAKREFADRSLSDSGDDPNRIEARTLDAEAQRRETLELARQEWLRSGWRDHNGWLEGVARQSGESKQFFEEHLDYLGDLGLSLVQAEDDGAWPVVKDEISEERLMHLYDRATSTTNQDTGMARIDFIDAARDAEKNRVLSEWYRLRWIESHRPKG